MRQTLLVLLLLGPVGLSASDAGSLGLLVLEKSVDTGRLTTALRDGSPLIRATAARLAHVREVTAVLPALREALASEKDPDAAREQIRAIVAIGDDADIERAVEASRRFPQGMDDVTATAISRLGGQRALDLYLRHRPALRDPSPDLRLMLWARPQLVTGAASRLLGSGDAEAWSQLLDAAIGAEIALEPNLLVAALASERAEHRVPAVEYVVRRFAAAPGQMPANVSSALETRSGDPAEVRESFARELIRRMRGEDPIERKEWLDWLEDNKGWPQFRSGPARELLTTKESKALEPTIMGGGRKAPGPGQSKPVIQPPYRLPGTLPPGLGDAVVAAAGCRSGWLGLGAAAVGLEGRVIDVKLDAVKSPPACKRALEALFRLSLAHPTSITSTTTTNMMVLVKAPKETVCLDEAPVRTRRTVRSKPQAPVVRRRVEPDFPINARQSLTPGTYTITVESVISHQGCVRSITIIDQTPHPETNAAAILALSRWRFQPSMLDGEAADAIFNLSVNFMLGR